MVAVQRPPTLALTLREFDRPRAMARKAFKSIPDLTQPAGALFPMHRDASAFSAIPAANGEARPKKPGNHRLIW
jgi:hypothetical protein